VREPSSLSLAVFFRHVLSPLLFNANGSSYHSDEADVHHASKGGGLLKAWSICSSIEHGVALHERDIALARLALPRRTLYFGALV
jgi:hypothetical protein